MRLPWFRLAENHRCADSAPTLGITNFAPESEEKLDSCRQHALVGKDQSQHVEALRWEGAVGSVRADPEASCQRNEEARGNRFLLRSWLRRLLAPPPAGNTRHPQLRDRPGKSAG